jgi:hypothetical protein
MCIGMKIVFFFLLLSTSLALHAKQTLPPWFLKSFKQLKLNHGYELKGSLKPTFLVADFDGDGRPDVAILANERRTKKKGILIIQDDGHKYFVFGAGKKFGNGSDNFKWATGWKIDDSNTANKRHALFIYDTQDNKPNSGWLIYWNGKKYVWKHTGR